MKFLRKRIVLIYTIAMLFLIYYVKLLDLIFTVLAVSVIDYPDGSKLKLWRPDASLAYMQGKHLVLSIFALVLLGVGLFYTALVFSWHWLIRLPDWKILAFIRHQNVQTFFEAYQAPYIERHRYWTGMLLLVRTILYLCGAVNVTNDPRVSLASILFAVGLVVSFKAFIGRLYNQWPLDILDLSLYVNLFIFSFFHGTLLTKRTSTNL